MKLSIPAGAIEPLTLLADGKFRVGEDEQSPERVWFDTIINGQALRLHYGTEVFYRFFTP